jgi:hypothetical protein
MGLSLTNILGLVINTTQLTILLITSRHGQYRKHLSSVAVTLLRSCLLGFPLLLYPIVTLEICLFAEPLLSNDCYIFAYSAVVA